MSVLKASFSSQPKALLLCPHSTIWYELHAREWPSKSQPAEVIIWQVGSGMKPNLAQTGMAKEISVRALLFLHLAQFMGHSVPSNWSALLHRFHPSGVSNW